MKKHLLKSLLALALVLITGNAWGEEVTKTYTLSNSDNGKEVTTDGIKWSIGQNAITASSSNMKLTGTVTVTLPAGATLNKVEITKSNSWGSGATVTFATGTTTLNTFSDSGTFALTSNKTDGVYTFMKSGTSSKNAWVKEIKVTFEAAAPTGPSITCADISNVSYEGVASATTTATFTNADGWTPSISAVDGTIVTSASIDGTTITYSVSENTGNTDREGSFTIKLSKDGETDVTKVVKVSQAHLVVDYATLPFVYDGGKSNLPDGLSQDGLGSDYSSSPKFKFDDTNDYVVLKINEAPGELQFDIKGNSFSSGTFKVQTSVDGETYIDLKTYSGQEPASTTTTETFSNLSSDIRFIKWVYTNKSTGNVALGKINLAKLVVVDYWVVKYDANGGEGAPDDVQVTKGESITISSTEPTRDGYDFAGWTKTKNGEDVVSGTFTPSENVTLYAKWTAKDIDLTASAPVGGTYTVKIGDADAVTITSAQTLTAKAGTTIVMTSTAAEGYKTQDTPFEVKDENNGKVNVSKSGDNYSFTMPGSATTIVAKYSKLYTITAATCTNGSITKIADKEGNEIASASMNSKIVVTATPNMGYKISKLYFVEEGSSEEKEFTSAGYFSMPEKNVTIHATFEESAELSLTFDFVSEVSNWKGSKSEAAAGDFIYQINGVDYTFTLSKSGDGIYQNRYQEPYYLMVNKNEKLGLPIVEGYKLIKVEVTTSSTTAEASVSITDGTNVVGGGYAQTWAKNAIQTYELSATEASTMYYISVSSEKNAQASSITLIYEKVASPVELTGAPSKSGYYYATFIGDKNMAVDENTIITTCYVENGVAMLNKLDGSVIPANSPVLVYSDNETITLTPTNAEANAEDVIYIEDADFNMLFGYTTDTHVDAVANTSYYALNVVDGNAGFFVPRTTDDPVNPSAANGFTAKAGKAYLKVVGAAPTIGFRFGDATQIENVNAMEAGKYFDLMGREVLNPAGGIYILNGKKVLVK